MEVVKRVKMCFGQFEHLFTLTLLRKFGTDTQTDKQTDRHTEAFFTVPQLKLITLSSFSQQKLVAVIKASEDPLIRMMLF